MSFAVDAAATRLGRAIALRTGAHPGRTGIHAIAEAREAFAARISLALLADRSLDVQYYIWRGDETGMLLFEALWKAADRGVRTRLLLDDNNTTGLDPIIAALDAHPNIEVRLFNPLLHRRPRLLNYLTDFRRLNRRMHNKSFTADGQATIVGGRNVGNEYFGTGAGLGFVDLDVLAVGPAVREVTAAFELYWTSPSARPARELVPPAGEDGVAALLARFARVRAQAAAREYLDAVHQTPLVRGILGERLPLEWSDAQLLRDDPAKVLDGEGRTDLLLLPALLRAVGEPETSFDLVSPYFVPGKEGSASLAALARRGVKVRILTNALAATDVAAVHAGYVKRRRDLLRAGVQLFELKPSGVEEAGRAGTSSSASLHAKTFATDRARVFVGSFNFDPRSALLNTEMGLLIDSPALAEWLCRTLDQGLVSSAYEVRLGASRRNLEWIEHTASGEVRHHREPGTGLFQRAMVALLSALPIEWLL